MSVRFRPRPIPTLAAAAMIALTLHLSQWQAGREREKLVLQALLDARTHMTAHVLKGNDRDGEGLKYRQVEVSGEYVAGKQIYIDNKDLNGAVGFYVLTPLKLAGSDVAVMVNRGWIARGSSYPVPPPAVPPQGEVEVHGMATVPSQRFLELSSANVQGSVWQNFTFERARANLGIDVLPVVVLAAQTSPRLESAAQTSPRLESAAQTSPKLMPVVETPNAGAEKHRGYAFQWMALAIAVFAVWIVVNLKIGKKHHE